MRLILNVGSQQSCQPCSSFFPPLPARVGYKLRSRRRMRRMRSRRGYSRRRSRSKSRRRSRGREGAGNK